MSGTFPLGTGNKLDPMTPHHQAVIDGGAVDLDAIDLAAVASLSIPDRPAIDGITPVHLAAYVGNDAFLHAVAASEHAERRGALHVCASNGNSATSLAARGGHLACVLALADAGALSLAATKSGLSPVYLAVQEGALDVVRALPERCGAPLADAAPGRILLSLPFAAARWNHVDVLRYLLGTNAFDLDAKLELPGPADEPDKKSGVCCTLFSYACRHTSLDGVQMLFDANAHLMALAESRAHATGKQVILKVATPAPGAADDGASTDDVAAAAEVAVYTKLRYFPVLPGSCMPRLTDGGETEATYRLTSAATKRALEQSPLHMAAFSGDVAKLKFLCERAGFDIDRNARVSDGRTPLYMAAADKHLAAAQYLVDVQRADVDIATNNGATPIYLACFFDDSDMARFLLARRANASIQYKGATPLIGAINNGSLEAVKVLLESGCDTSSPYQGMSPLEYARSQNQADIVRYMDQ